MGAHIIDGKYLAATLRMQIKDRVTQKILHGGRTPGLAVILVGADPASEVYVRSKRKACGEVGIVSFSYDLPVDTTQTALLTLIDGLNNNAVTLTTVRVQLSWRVKLDAGFRQHDG